ncbi:unnamed protein product [Rhizoctonia solani]|uniref:WD40 repeat-like protein n=1 Tax=Rhizoctonia solani TaxID=456999 RepID=A0A8H3E3J5_9AGAM|nr:unnamed protein product [Rhizoctonia solani]
MLSPDATRIATFCEINFHLWNVKNGDMLLTLEYGCENVIFSPDGTRIAAGYYDSLRIWDAQTGNDILGLLGHCPAGMIAFSHDNSRIIHTSDPGQAIYVRDAHNGDLIRQLSSRYDHPIGCLGYSPDGRYIVSGTSGRTITVWNAQSGEVMLDGLEGHECEVISIMFLPDSRIITGCMGGTVCTWNPRQHDLAYAPGPTSAPSMLITRVKFSPNGMQFVSGSEDGTICIWDSYTGEVVVGPIKAHTDRITALDFVDGRIVSGSDDGAMCVYDALGGQVLLGPLQVHQGRKGTIDAIAYLDDRNQIVTGSRRKSPWDYYSEVNLWNARTGERILSPLTDLDMKVMLICFSPDGICIFGTRYEYIKIVIWDVSNGTLRSNSYKSPLGGFIDSVCYSPDGALIVSASGRGIFLVGAYTGTKVLGPLVGSFGTIGPVSLSPDGTRLVSGSSDNTIRVWNIQTGEMMFELVHGHEGGIGSIAYSPDGTRILSLSDDMTARIHDARSAEERALSRSTAKYADWVVSPNEWVVDNQSRLPLSAPVHLQQDLMWPRTGIIAAPEEWALSRSTAEYADWDVILNEWMVPAHLLVEQGFMWSGTETIADHEEGELLWSTDEDADWTINPDGWVVDDKSRLLVWVPAGLRRALMRPTTQVMVAHWGYLRLKFDKSRMGESWEKGYTSRL